MGKGGIGSVYCSMTATSITYALFLMEAVIEMFPHKREKTFRQLVMASFPPEFRNGKQNIMLRTLGMNIVSLLLLRGLVLHLPQGKLSWENNTHSFFYCQTKPKFLSEVSSNFLFFKHLHQWHPSHLPTT